MNGSFSMMVKTSEENGLLMLALGSILEEKNYIALEIFDGVLFLHIMFGSVLTKIKSAKEPFHLSNGEWHQIDIKIKQTQGRLTIDDGIEVFTIPDVDGIDLNGPLYLGGIDKFDKTTEVALKLSSMIVKNYFVGCIKDVRYNNILMDIVSFAHDQNSGSVRSSCHSMPNQCHDRPCNNGGNCKESWNRYRCDCTGTSFFGATCSRGTNTIQLNGDNFIRVHLEKETNIDILHLSLRFRTREDSGLIFAAQTKSRRDFLTILLEKGRIRVTIHVGLYSKEMLVGQGLSDDLWHTLRLKRKNLYLEGSIDDDDSNKLKVTGLDISLIVTTYYIGGHSNEENYFSPSNFTGRIQQLILNGKNILEWIFLQHFKYDGNVKFQQVDDIIYNSISFLSHHTYIQLPQMKIYNNIDIFFKFKTSEQDGLLLYNEGKNGEFIAIEIENGHIHYTVDMGYGPVTMKDNSKQSLSDDRFHSVWIQRPTRFSQVLIIDNFHKVSSSGLGDNYFLNLNGFLHLGGVTPEMIKRLPEAVKTRVGFQGCFSNLEINNEAIDPFKDALVKSMQVSKECQESYAFEFSNSPGLLTYKYPDEKQPDTKSDTLTVAFITVKKRCTIVRIDSSQSNDFLEFKLENGFIIAEYNLGTESITVADRHNILNDGDYHVVKFIRNGPNATLQVDNKEEIQKIPDGRHLTVFNSQQQVQIGGKLHDSEKKIEQGFQGIIAGLIYNGLNFLESNFHKKTELKKRGSVKFLEKIPMDYKNSVRLTMKNREKNTEEKNIEKGGWTNCDDDELCEGSAALTHITDVSSKLPVSAPGKGVYFDGGGYMPCGDDEDICDFGSGDSETSMISPQDKLAESRAQLTIPVDSLILLLCLAQFV